MPHPLVIVAGVAIVVGASYMIYNEVVARNSNQQEKAYNDYCATMKAEKEAREQRLSKEKSQRDEDDQNKTEEDNLLPLSQLQNLKFSPRLSHLRRRKNTRDQRSRSSHQNHAPLIDLSEQCYPPKRNTQEFEGLSTQAKEEEMRSCSSASRDTDAVIFAAPVELIEQEGDNNSNTLTPALLHDHIKSLLPRYQQPDSLIASSTNPLIVVNPQEQEQAQESSLLNSDNLSKKNFDPMVNQIAMSNEGPSHHSTEENGVKFEVSESVIADSNHHDEEDSESHKSVIKVDLNLPTSTPTSDLDSFDDGWSDLGSETFETV